MDQLELKTARGPYLDIEVLVRPTLTVEDSDEDMVKRAHERARHLLDPFGRNVDLLISLGRPERRGESRELDANAIWNAALSQLGRSDVIANEADGPAQPCVFSVTRSENETDPYAYVAFITLTSGDDVEPARAFLQELAAGDRCGVAPLYVIGLDPDGATESKPWQQVRASLVLTPASETSTEILTTSRTPIDARQRTADVSFVPCPTFQQGVGDPGATTLRLDVVRAHAAIAFSHDDPPKNRRPLVQVTRPMHSVSRVSHGERALYSHVTELLDRETAERSAAGKGIAGLQEFRTIVDASWKDDGYVTLCTSSGALPGLNAPKAVTYMLLLLIRPREGGGYELLLSNHSPLHPSTMSEWNTLLLPAFQYPATLLGHLRDDVMRQATERAEDLERGDQALGFERAVREVLATDIEENVWLDQVREIGNFMARKISPTTGVVTEYDYHFVTLLPFVQPTAEGETAGEIDRILEWFAGLDVVRDVTPGADLRLTLPMDALRSHGAGLRFEPAVELLADPDLRQRLLAQKAPPGAVWFPLGGTDDPSPWKQVPSIRARNSDVMTQLDKILKEHLEAEELPGELLVGGGTGESGYDVLTTYRFDAPHDAPDDRVPGTSTKDALALVEFADASDLAGQSAYPGQNFRRVYLLRADVGARGKDRDAVLVIAAEHADSKALEDLTEEDALGRLRPVQRYVLNSGLRRVVELQEALDAQAGDRDPWGFARVRKDGVGIPVSVTPPVIEQLHWTDLGEPSSVGQEDREVREFVVCDGSHRVVAQVWLEERRRLVSAVLVDSQPAEPYYALPFGSLEWGITAANRLDASPPQAGKYLVRSVDPQELPSRNREIVNAIPPTSRYRRYYRNLEKGFGRLGGQGGRFA